jgi:hypothetical protein
MKHAVHTPSLDGKYVIEIQKTRLWMIVVTIALGLLVGWSLSSANLTLVDITANIQLILMVCILGMILDLRKIALSSR